MKIEITFAIDLLNNESTPKTKSASITVAMVTTIVEDCRSGHFGHSTLSLNSVYEPFIKSTKLIIYFLHGHKDSNPDQRFWRPVSYHWTMPVVKKSSASFLTEL